MFVSILHKFTISIIKPSDFNMIRIQDSIFVLAKSILFANINTKVICYLPFIFLVSITADLYPLPDSYLNYKDNLLNRDFMKLSYYWTLVVLLPFLLIVTYAYSIGNLFYIIFNCVRPFLIIIICKLIRGQFYIVEQAYSSCSRKALLLKSEEECTSEGYIWNEFSLSGHTFYMFYCSIVIMEEVKLHKIWEAVENYRFWDNNSKNIVFYLNFFMKFWLVVMSVVVILLDFSTLSTLVYFHQIDEKLFGGILAIGTWYIEYKLLFSKLIKKDIERFCHEKASFYDSELAEKKYLLEARKMFYFKPIRNFTPFIQLHYNI